MKRRGFLSLLFGTPAAIAAASVLPEGKFVEDAMKIADEPAPPVETFWPSADAPFDTAFTVAGMATVAPMFYVESFVVPKK